MPCPGSHNKLVVQQGIRNWCCFPVLLLSCTHNSPSQELLHSPEWWWFTCYWNPWPPSLKFSTLLTLVELATLVLWVGFGVFYHFPECRLSRNRQSLVTSGFRDSHWIRIHVFSQMWSARSQTNDGACYWVLFYCLLLPKAYKRLCVLHLFETNSNN